MTRIALGVFAAILIAACARDESAALTDTVAVPPVDGSIPLVSPGSVPARTERPQATADQSAIDVGGVDTTIHLSPAETTPKLDVDTPRRGDAPVPVPDPANPDSIIGRDSAHTGPFIPAPVPPDTGHDH
ncbi:hypothetical protein BH23GEM2_BH23GEM2_15520 [soil metagenome]